MAVTSFDFITEDVGENKEDLVIIDGDFQILASDQQHIQHILKAYKGQYYQHPTLGFGIFNDLNSSTTPTRFKQRIKTELKSDNYTTLAIEVDADFKVNLDAERIL